MSTDDELVLILLGMVFVGGLLGSVGLLHRAGVDWLIEHRVVVGRSADPLLTLPGADGAGLDGPRVALLVAGLLVVIAVAGSAVRRWTSSRGGDLA